ncbi:TRI25 ligase, partial [Polypterus senegalus]
MKEEVDPEDSVYCCGCMQEMQEPVFLPCGHGFCTECNKGLMTETGVSCCSQCKRTSTKRTIRVQKSSEEETTVDVTKKRRLSSPVKRDLRPGEVMCDFCSETKCRAVKSCLNCLISYCETHVQSHYDIPIWRNHKLIDPIENLKMRVCSQHEKPMELFCQTDQTCICYLCEETSFLHSSHCLCELPSLPKESRRLQKVPQDTFLNLNYISTKDLLKAKMKLIHKAVKKKQQKHQAKKETAKLIMASAKREQQECEEIISLLKNLLTQLETKLSDLITEHKRMEVKKARLIQKQLENEIEDLKTKYNEMIKLSDIEDHTLFLQVIFLHLSN